MLLRAVAVVVLIMTAQVSHAAEIIYLWAADCKFCARMDQEEIPKYLASRHAKRTPLRKVDIGSYRRGDMSVRSSLPADLRYIADNRMEPLGGSPRFLVVSNKEVLLNVFGRPRFESHVLPYVQSLR